MRTKTNDELADLMGQTPVHRSTLIEAALRLRSIELEKLLTCMEIVEAINSSPLIDKHTAELVEPLVMGLALNKQSSARLSSLAGRIISGADYTHGDVLSLAACVMSQVN